MSHHGVTKTRGRTEKYKEGKVTALRVDTDVVGRDAAHRRNVDANSVAPWLRVEDSFSLDRRALYLAVPR